MTGRLDWPAIRSGAWVCLVFAVPFSLLARWAADGSDGDGLAILLTMCAVAGFVVGSGVAAWVQRVGLPLVHAIITASLTYLGAQAVFILLRLVTGRDVRWFAALFNLTPVLFAGAVGGMLGLVLQRRGFVPSSQRRTGGSDG